MCLDLSLDRSRPEALDETVERVELAAATPQVRLQEGDARRLPFEDGQFDALTFTYLLRYVEDPPATLRELARVVKPGVPNAVSVQPCPALTWSVREEALGYH